MNPGWSITRIRGATFQLIPHTLYVQSSPNIELVKKLSDKTLAPLIYLVTNTKIQDFSNEARRNLPESIDTYAARLFVVGYAI